MEHTIFDYLQGSGYETDRSAYMHIYQNIPYGYEIERRANAVIERDGLENLLFYTPDS